MAGETHPAQTAFESRDDQQMIAYAKEHLRQTVADAEEVRGTDFSLQFGGLYIRSNAANYKLDTEELGEDDGVNIVRDFLGNAFVRAVDTQSETQRVHTASGTVNVAVDDVDMIFIDKTVAGPTAVQLPSAADRTRSITIYDGKGDAAANNITIAPESGEKIYGLVDYTPVIDGNGGHVTLTPRADGTGWY